MTHSYQFKRGNYQTRWGLVGFALGVAICTRVAATEAKIVDQIAAVVGNEIILLSEVQKEGQALLAQLEQAAKAGQAVGLEQRRKNIQKEALDQVIDGKLVKQQARQMEIDREIAKARAKEEQNHFRMKMENIRF